MKKLIPITVLCLFFLNCEQGWLKDILFPVKGCMDSNACNYAPAAEEDDGSCITLDCAGQCANLAAVDSCGVCDVDPTNDCVQDCAGVWGGTTAANECTVTDVEGNVYQTVRIGEQLWMAENLKVTKYKDGSEIPTGYSNSDWLNLSTGAYAAYDDDPSNANIYGNLYNWYTIGDTRGVCMEGWHVPTSLQPWPYDSSPEDDFFELEHFLGLVANGTGHREGTTQGGALKETGTEHWCDEIYDGDECRNIGATNETGFTALPGGRRVGETTDDWNEYNGMGRFATFWSSSIYYATAWAPEITDDDKAWVRTLENRYASIHYHEGFKNSGFSIRCIKD